MPGMAVRPWPPPRAPMPGSTELGSKRSPWAYLSLSFTMSPGRFLAQNLVVLSCDDVASTWPMGCQARPHTVLSCAPRIVAWGWSMPRSQKAREPSPPLLTNRSWWMGCHLQLVTSRFWPLYVSISRSTRMSKILSTWSLPPVSRKFPLACQCRQVTVFLWPCSDATSLPPAGSQSFTTLSLLPEATSARVGCHCTPLTSPPWADMACTTLPCAKSQIFTVVSSLQEANLRSVGAKETPLTASLCASYSRLALLRVTVQYWMMPPSSPVSSQVSLFDHVMQRTGLS
mmetsp:Transcript_17620/g.49584  ORF Transcript_17620/g.49584 Transcript_17620/m.49584 type:complete len:286 (-) Transcript_17620:102-959(-)